MFLCTCATYLKCERKTERNCFLKNSGGYSPITKPDNYKKIIYFCSNNLFLAIYGKISNPQPCVLEIDLFFSTDSTIKAVNFVGREHKSNSNMSLYIL